MSNKVKDIDIKNRICYVFDDINIKHFDPNKIKIDEKSYKNILIYYSIYMTIKDSKYVKINSGNPLYLIFSKLNRLFDENDKNKYLMQVSTNCGKEKIKKYEELWSRIRDFTGSIT